MPHAPSSCWRPCAPNINSQDQHQLLPIQPPVRAPLPSSTSFSNATCAKFYLNEVQKLIKINFLPEANAPAHLQLSPLVLAPICLTHQLPCTPNINSQDRRPCTSNPTLSTGALAPPILVFLTLPAQTLLNEVKKLININFQPEADAPAHLQLSPLVLASICLSHLARTGALALPALI